MIKNKKEVVTKFKKASGSINNIIQMLENDSYCVDIMQQNLGTIGTLRSAHQDLLEHHLKNCFVNKVKESSSKKIEVASDELMQLFRLYNK